MINGKNIRREQLLLITNVTNGTVIYNFSDPSLQAASYVNATNSVTGLESTTIILNYITAAMSASDKLSILVEETYTELIPAEVMRDPVDKLRVSTPQSLIDTDFEYGIQPTKWEGLSLLNNRPGPFYDSTQGLSSVAVTPNFPNASGSYTVTGATASGKVVTISINNTTGIVAGLPVFIQGTLDGANADGWWLVETVTSNVSFTYTVTNTPATSLFDSTKTYVYIGGWYTGAAIPTGAGSIVLNGTVATVTTTYAHGLRAGDGIYIANTTGATGTLNSSWVVLATPFSNQFTFTCTATGAITTPVNTTLYVRPLGYIQHRAFDGGVQFSNVTPYHGYQLIRQTRRQFRYQSGKGMQFSTGSILKPSVQVETMTAVGSVVTVTSKYPHGMLPGAQVRVAGANETAYNGTFTVTGATTLTFTYTAGSAPSATPATGFPLQVNPQSWYGSANRVGLFDSQNGMFFEFDGQQIWCVKRSTTTQISGAVAATFGTNSIVGTTTKFSSQLKPGDAISIRGMTYFVQTITSDTQMYIYPEYRGVTVANAVVSKTVDTRFPQSQWNIDKMDGTGASLMTLDLARMQMFYIDYTWYGAGAIRFGFKNNRGEVIYCHRIPNNNVNTEAYMRSGNLVARYETNTLPMRTYLTATLLAATGVGGSISINDASLFPSTGTVVLTQASDLGAVTEYINYSAKTTSTFTIAARNTLGGTGTAVQHTYSLTAPINVELFSPQQSSTISHWGSAVIMDGRFDNDKSFLFNYGQNTQLNYANAGTRYPVFSIRLGPSVDNGLTGLLGQREIVNRMQLTPASAGVYASTATVRVEVVLNGRVSTGTFAAVGGSSLAQYATHATGATIQGGESIFTFFAPAGGISTQSLDAVRDIGTSILGGGFSNNVPNTPTNVYPDGPDILTLCVTPLAGNAFVAARMSWTEAQA